MCGSLSELYFADEFHYSSLEEAATHALIDYSPSIGKLAMVTDDYNPYLDKIRDIDKIIQSDKYTIIIDVYGNKTIVKYRKLDDSDSDYFDKWLGLYFCLLRYFLDSKRYHDLVETVFMESPINIIPTDIYQKIRYPLIALIGSKKLTYIENRFEREVSYED